MKLVIIEPLGVEKEKLLGLAQEKLEERWKLSIMTLVSQIQRPLWNVRRMRISSLFPICPLRKR